MNGYLVDALKSLPTIRFDRKRDAALVNELTEARDERRLFRAQKQMAAVKLLIIDELGFMPLARSCCSR